MDFIKILGFVAAALTTCANLPQAVKIIRTKSTKSISTATYALLFSGLVTWLIYGILINDLPIILANSVSAVLAGIILTMKLVAKKKENQK
ncbi:MAG TPA: SemiSWEET transporter [Flavobacterium sp.]|jgi:MtN3 and saliva related transmembrane protein